MNYIIIKMQSEPVSHLWLILLNNKPTNLGSCYSLLLNRSAQFAYYILWGTFEQPGRRLEKFK